jgi:hypothetical protein
LDARRHYTNHKGRSEQSNSSCNKVDGVDEKTVDELLEIGRPLGRWLPENQCQSFVRQVLDQARRTKRGTIINPHEMSGIVLVSVPKQEHGKTSWTYRAD